MKGRCRSSRGSSAGGVCLLVAGLVALGLGSCSGSAVEPDDEERRIGVIMGFNTDDPRIDIPDTVHVGAEVLVEVTTYGNACVRKGDTAVESTGNRVTITPFNYVYVGADACADVLRGFIHQAALEFTAVGAASVVIVGRTGGIMTDGDVQVDRTVIVVPGAHSP